AARGLPNGSGSKSGEHVAVGSGVNPAQLAAVSLRAEGSKAEGRGTEARLLARAKASSRTGPCLGRTRMSVDSYLTFGHAPGPFARPAALVHTFERHRVAIAGFGTVGSAIAARLTGPEPVDGLTLTQVFHRRAFEKRAARR